MRDRERGVSDAQLRRNLGGSAVEAQVGTTAGFPHNFNLQPVHSTADAGSQRLGGSLLGRKSSGQAFGRIAFSQAIRLLGGREDAIQKPLPVALKRLLNTRDFDKVSAAANDHAVYQLNIPELRGLYICKSAVESAGNPASSRESLPRNGTT